MVKYITFSDKCKQNLFRKGDIKTMEMVLNNGFYEMTQDEMMEIVGGGFWDVVNSVTSFLANRIVWTNARYIYDNLYVPITPSNGNLKTA